MENREIESFNYRMYHKLFYQFLFGLKLASTRVYKVSAGEGLTRVSAPFR